MASLYQMVTLFKETDVSQGTYAKLKKKRLESKKNAIQLSEKSSFADDFNEKNSPINDFQQLSTPVDKILLNNQNYKYSQSTKAEKIKDRLETSGIFEILKYSQALVRPVSNDEKFTIMPRMEELIKADVKKMKKQRKPLQMNHRIDFFTFASDSPDDIVIKNQKAAFR